MPEKSFRELRKTVRHLRSPNGCPWDRKQTLETMAKEIISEAEEVKEAVEKCDNENLREELGDVLFNVLAAIEIADEQGLFGAKEVIDEANEKLKRRHPHVFGDDKAKTPEDAKASWDRMKARDKNGGTKK